MIYFTRHGQSQANVQGIFAGAQMDSPLTENGILQAREAGVKLAKSDIKIDRIVSSPLSRAQITAGIIASHIDFDVKEIITDTELTEYDTGHPDNPPKKSVSAKELVSWPGAEDPEKFFLRTKKAIQKYQDMDGNTLIVSHNGLWRVIEAVKRGKTPAEFHDIENLENSKIIELDLP